MRYFPLYVDLQGRNCLLVGKGKMIEEKAQLLSKSGAILRRRDSFVEADARDVFLIVADVDEETAANLQAFGERNRVFVNVVDKPKYCGFIVPAVVDRKDLLMSISTSGKSPALAGWIREQLQESYGQEFSVLLDVFGETRDEVKDELPRYGDRKAFYRGLLKGGIADIAKEGEEAVRSELERRLLEFRRTLSDQTRP
jgi:siroheme synthase-like protein